MEFISSFCFVGYLYFAKYCGILVDILMKYNNGLPYQIGTLSFYVSLLANFGFLRMHIWNWTTKDVSFIELVSKTGELIKNFLQDETIMLKFKDSSSRKEQRRKEV